MATVTVTRSGDHLIAMKQVSTEHARDLEREAETLQRLDHPGVVRFVDLVETPDQGRALHTEFVSSDTWSTRPITDPTGRAAAVAAVAEVVADLHDMGFAHCRIDPSHVLHGDGDRPVLCGFRRATEVTPENRRSDLVAIADLCHDPEMEPGALAGKLSDLADAARAGRLDLRELARRLAMVPDKRSSPTEPDRTAAGTGHGHRSRPRKRLLVVVAAVLGASASVAASTIWSRGQQGNAPVTITDGAAALTDPTVSPNNTSAMVEAGEHLAAAATSPTPMIPGIFGAGILGASIEAEPRPLGGNAEQEVGSVLEHGGHRYGVGVPGDFVETGDWDCDGESTPAIVRPSTGDVVLFNAWPAPHQSIAMPVRWQVDAPTGAESVAHGSCHLLRIYTAAGSRLFDPMEGQ